MKSMRLLVLAMLTVALAGPREAESCGPFLPSAQFSFVFQPPQGVFARGQLGILRSKYYRKYLVVAYRYLTGVPLTKDEAAAFDPQVAPAPVPATQRPLAPVGEWLTARKRVPGTSVIQDISQDRELKQFQFYQNCLDDAFLTASRTLTERIQRWGANSPQVAEWVRGQDAVFQNCHEGSVVPAALTDGDPVLLADRRYQIAAAEFYSQQYEAAERDFGAIASDAGSPWHDLGKLLVARAQIRESTIDEKPDKLPRAAQTLDAILQDPQQSRWHSTATGLREYIEARLDPEARLTELSDELTHPTTGRQFDTALSDFTMIWDRRNRGPAAKSDLADWITAFQASDWQHALDRWRAHPGDAWLVAALTSVPHDNPAVPDLLAAAKQVPASSAAWPSVTSYAISLTMAKGDQEGARAWADQALRAKLPADVQNEFLAQRFQLARGWDDFLQFAARKPVANDDGAGLDLPLADALIPASHAAAAFGTDFTTPFNEEVPLTRWVNAASSTLLPPSLRADIAQAGWVRAVVLKRPQEAQLLAQRLAELRPSLRSGMEGWLSEKDPRAAQFAAVLLMLHTPGLQPLVREGFGRLTADGKIDDFRDNWWSLGVESNDKPADAKTPPDFLPESERTAGRNEWNQIMVTASQATDYLNAETVGWARQHRDDPRVPEALHLAVRTSRYTSNAKPTTYPKQAFQLLHSWYPKSSWTVQTPYWY